MRRMWDGINIWKKRLYVHRMVVETHRWECSIFLGISFWCLVYLAVPTGIFDEYATGSECHLLFCEQIPVLCIVRPIGTLFRLCMCQISAAQTAAFTSAAQNSPRECISTMHAESLCRCGPNRLLNEYWSSYPYSLVDVVEVESLEIIENAEFEEKCTNKSGIEQHWHSAAT